VSELSTVEQREDEPTLVGNAAQPSWAGTSARATSTRPSALPLGTKLGEFEIIGLIGVGGFGIVYLAHDGSLDRQVALKEYMPSELAERESTTSVAVRSQRHAEAFAAGLRSFINEARLLAQFDHPSLVKVYRFWEANGTAYMVMPFYEGVTLKQALRDLKSVPEEAWLRKVMSQLLDALEVIHGRHCLHRDIAPDNILMLRNDHPLLLDFGAARKVIGDMTQALTVILKPGYAPIEQYAEVPNMKQGPWTDLYALASVIYFAITGKTPAPAVARVISDPVIRVAQAAAGRYSERFLHGIDAALAVKPEDRPQNVAQFRSALGLDQWHGSSQDRRRRDAGAAVPTEETQSASKSAPTSVLSVQPDRNPRFYAGLSLVALAVMTATATWLWFRGEHRQANTAAGAELKTRLASFKCARLDAQLDGGTVIVRGHVADDADLRRIRTELAAVNGVRQVEQLGVRVIPRPYCEVVSALGAHAAPESSALRIGIKGGGRAAIEGNQLVVELTGADFPGYVYADLYDPKGNVAHLLPNAKEKKNRLESKQRIVLGDNPMFGMQWEVVPPLGNHLLVVMASASTLFQHDRKDLEDSATYLRAVGEALRARSSNERFEANYMLVDFLPKK
jgi:serine/threonine protein kinase